MKCIIIDQEFTARRQLIHFINTFSKIEVEREFDDGAEALQYLTDNNIDVVFLETDIPNLNGIDLGRIIYEKNKDIKIIFITKEPRYAIDAFDIHAFDYILKPYSKERIISGIKRIEISCCKEENERNNSDKISVMQGDKIYVINIDDIYFIESQGRGIKIYTRDTEYSSKIKISEIQERLPKKAFYKCHRCYLVNLEKISEIEPWFNSTYVLKFKNIEKEVPVSRKNVKEFREMLALK